MRLYIALFSVLILAGCKGESDIEELKQYIDQVHLRPAKPPEPLPQFQPFIPFKYAASSLRSPFVKVVPQMDGEDPISPDSKRVREPLESFPLDSLKMVGTLEATGVVWALIQDTDGVVHRVRIGNYMGRNYGQVVRITPKSIHLIEIVPDGQGSWREKKAEIAISE